MAKAAAAASPPEQRPRYPSDRELSYGIKWSLIFHLALFTAILIKGLVFPTKPIVYIPSLRVDIVGLPDLLKKELKEVPQAPVAEKNSKEEQAEPAEAQKKEKTVTKRTEKADPDEMVLKPKKSKDAERDAAREKRIKSALARIKALTKISAEDKPAASVAIKGNRISKGSSLSGDARENSQSGYLDELRSRLSDNWAIPVWLQRQNLNAQVLLWIDSRGRMRNFKFLKTSGNSQFDDLVKRTLQDSQPYPAPPAELASELLVDGISIGFPL